MVAAESGRIDRRRQTLVLPLHFDPAQASPFTRADVVFADVDHSAGSFEVRLYFNNPNADAATPRDPAVGYAGRFTVFGHGGCYGDVGHCDVPDPSSDPTDIRPQHPLTPLDTYVTVTDALRRLVDAGTPLEGVTLVTLSLTPNRADRGPAPDLLRFGDVTLQTYLD